MIFSNVASIFFHFNIYKTNLLGSSKVYQLILTQFCSSEKNKILKLSIDM